MGRTKRHQMGMHSLESPAQKKANSVKAKYRGKKISPEKRNKIRKALYQVSHKMSFKKAAAENDLPPSFLYRRWRGDVDLFKVKGPQTVFSEQEEEEMARWLEEMAQRGMGLRMCEFLDFVGTIVKKENRKVPFKNGRPGKKWYYGFMGRNKHIITTRMETPLELKRAKVTKEDTDKWYTKFREFLSVKDLLDKPSRIWNADETGFNMGYNKSKVIGPSRKDLPVPQVTSGKERLTVMFCGNAGGQMMPPFLVYPGPKPRGYNPLNGSIEGSAIEYTPKGWMDTTTFSLFIDHFDKYAGIQRPVVLLIDSVSSHVNRDIFMKALEKGIEIYRIVPNATHMMQPLDKGVFGPLKAQWHLTARKHMRENPGRPIGKENFAEKLTETFLNFYKPLTVKNAFKSSGIYPVDSTVITSTMLKPSLTYTNETSPGNKEAEKIQPSLQSDQSKASIALEVFEETLSTPIRQRNNARLKEGYDLEGESPCFDVFKKLHKRANPEEHSESSSNQNHDFVANFQMLAETAFGNEGQSLKSSMSPILAEALVFPKSACPKKPVRKTLTNTLPDNLTSADCIRQLSLKQLESVRKFAAKEKRCKALYIKNEIKKDKQVKKGKGPLIGSKRGKCQASKSASSSQSRASSEDEEKQVKKGKGPLIGSKRGKCQASKSASSSQSRASSEDDACCMACDITWLEDLDMDLERTWIECDSCKGWVHAECLTSPVDQTASFLCPKCIN